MLPVNLQKQAQPQPVHGKSILILQEQAKHHREQPVEQQQETVWKETRQTDTQSCPTGHVLDREKTVEGRLRSHSS